MKASIQEQALLEIPSIAQKNDIYQALDLAKSAQISGDYKLLVQDLAGPLYPQIIEIFTGHSLLIYLLTDSARRQVWNAIFASTQGRTWMARYSPELVVEKLMTLPSDRLVSMALGSCPIGFLAMMRKMPHPAGEPRFYELLHGFLHSNPDQAQYLVSLDAVTLDFLELLHELPSGQPQVPLAKAFRKRAAYAEFMTYYEALTGQACLSDEAIRKLCQGENPTHLLESKYNAMEFPAAVIPNSDQLRHLNTPSALHSAATQYANCLRFYVSEAFRNESQFYVFTCRLGNAYVLDIRNDAPFGWMLEDIKNWENEVADVAVQEEVRDYLGQYGIRCTPSMDKLHRKVQRRRLL